MNVLLKENCTEIIKGARMQENARKSEVIYDPKMDEPGPDMAAKLEKLWNRPF